MAGDDMAGGTVQAPGGGWVPVPDPTKLTDAAIERATSGFRRETDALRELLSERIETSAGQRAREIASLRELLEARLGDMEKVSDRRFAQASELPEQIRAVREADIQQLRELIEAQLNGLRTLTAEQLNAIGKATELRLRVTEELPGQTRDQIDQLRKLHEERFASIAQQFAERDVRTSQAQQASDQALNAALQAAKELVNAQGEASSAAAVKSETSFTKQIDQIGTIISTLEKALDSRITELKERIDRGEGQQTGQAQQVDTGRYDAIFDQTNRLAQQSSQRATIATAVAVAAIISSILIAVIPLLLGK